MQMKAAHSDPQCNQCLAMGGCVGRHSIISVNFSLRNS